MMRRTTRTALAILLAAPLAAPSVAFAESINAGNRDARTDYPFQETAIAEFDTPWAIAFLPDGRLLVTTKPGRIFLVAQDGKKTPVEGVPAVEYAGQNGLLDIAVAPDFAGSAKVYFTYVEPGDG